jgi:formylglycine-generating enzyme required for sulfatase activity
VVEQRLAALRPKVASGTPVELAATIETLKVELEPLGSGPGAGAAQALEKEAEARLEAQRSELQRALRERVSALAVKKRYGAAIDAATADAATVRALRLEAFLSDLKGEVVGALERDMGEDYVPAGLFHAGADGELVTTGGFYLEHTEVTNDAYARVAEREKLPLPASWTGGKVPAGAGSRPVTGLSYDECERYAKAIGKRLPTALEWEKAARGRDDARAYPWGGAFVSGKANLLDGGSGALEDVQARPGDASPFGVVGLAGNALEWVAGESGPLVAGGGYGSDALAARVYSRSPVDRKTRDAAIGFRCARDLETGSEK